jgi:hypothetical protein
MADHNVNGSPLVSGNLMIPRTGRWTADCLLSGSDSRAVPGVGSQVSLVVGDVSRMGTVTASGFEYQKPRLRIVAGNDALETIIQPRDYRNYNASDIIIDVIRDAGEVAGVNWSQIQVVCPNWIRSGGTARANFNRLLRLAPAGLRWRSDRLGRLDIYRDLFVDGGFEHIDLGIMPPESMAELGVQSSDLEPGQAVSVFGISRNVERILYNFASEDFRAYVWY